MAKTTGTSETKTSPPPILDTSETRELLQAAWQNPGVLVYQDILSTISAFGSQQHPTLKPFTRQFRYEKNLCWEKYWYSSHVRMGMDTLVDWTCGAGFEVFSDNYEINEFLFDLFYSRRNKLWDGVCEWMLNMVVGGELFLLIILDEKGDIRVRVLEDASIVGGPDGTGVIVDPDDPTQNLFYFIKYGTNYLTRRIKDIAIDEIIPDVNILYNPALLKQAEGIMGFDLAKTEKSKAPVAKRKFIDFGGYYRFILPWKNLQGVKNLVRSTSPLGSIMEALNMYYDGIKWLLDYVKACTSYTNIMQFADTPAGAIAAATWKKATKAEKDATGLTKVKHPGATLFMLPGMSYKTEAPQLPTMSGNLKDLINMVSAGIGIPVDISQGDTAQSTFSSVKMTRNPLVIKTENLQAKKANFMKYEFCRLACHIKAVMSSSFHYQYTIEEVVDFVEGKPVFKKVKRDAYRLVKVALPDISLYDDPNKANLWFGSKHAGAYGHLGLSQEDVAKKFSIDDLDRQRRKAALEQRRYGAQSTALDMESQLEKRLKNREEKKLKQDQGNGADDAIGATDGG